MPKPRGKNSSIKTRIGAIETDTPIIPHVVAESVLEQSRGLGGDWFMRTRAEMYLVERAKTAYRRNKIFRQKIKSKQGRDILYAFMRHWLMAWVNKNYKINNKNLPGSPVLTERAIKKALRKGIASAKELGPSLKKIFQSSAT